MDTDATANYTNDDSDATESEPERTAPNSSRVGLSKSDPSRCSFTGSKCDLAAPVGDATDRRVISHFFGRNKKETRGIPSSCWHCYCRKHYQRQRYRMDKPGFVELQMGMVRKTVENLRAWGGVEDFKIGLRKRVETLIKEADDYERAVEHAARNKYSRPEPPEMPEIIHERCLLPFVGSEKSFNVVFAVLDRATEYCREHGDLDALQFEIIPRFKPTATTTTTKSTRRVQKTTTSRRR